MMVVGFPKREYINGAINGTKMQNNQINDRIVNPDIL